MTLAVEAARWLQQGARIARRYELSHKLGAGTTGEVWAATDTLTQSEVAVKIVFPSVDAKQLHREIAALRMLRLPGVVRLLADGVAEGVSYIVTELVTGDAFPGATGPLRWQDIEPITLSLLETLYQVHTAGVVHRDLKPENILVADQKPLILDFGLVGFDAPQAKPSRAWDGGATPDYMAPEQLRGSTITPATDLYAVGLMLYEALSGKAPHPKGDLIDLLRSRLRVPCARLETVAPAVPAVVADAIDRMLAIAPEDRPASALEAIALLSRGANRPAVLPWLGRPDLVQHLARVLRHGRPIDVVGRNGMGRTRTLAAVVAALPDREAVWLCSGESAFSSLVPAIGIVDPEPTAHFDDVVADVRRRIADRFAKGAIIVADNAEHIDPWSVRLLDDTSGPILRALTEVRPREHMELEPLDAADLMPLFGGHEALFHLQTDGAQHVLSRTGGVPREVAREVETLVAHGHAEWISGRIVMTRDTLDHVEGEHVPIAPTRFGSDLPARVDAVLCALQLAPTIDVGCLARTLGRAVWEVEGELDELHQEGHVRRVGDRFVPLERAPQFDALGPGERRMWHARIAASMLAGSDRRYAHLLAAAKQLTDDVVLDVIAEAYALAQRWTREGHIRRAITLLAETVALVRTVAVKDVAWASEWLERLLSLWVAAAVDDRSPAVLDRVLHEVTEDDTAPNAPQLIALIGAAKRLHTWTSEALDAANAIPPFSDETLERKRQIVRVCAGRRSSVEAEEAAVLEAMTWANGDTSRQACAQTWLGALLYRKGQYLAAVAAYGRQLNAIEWRTERIAATIHMGAAMLETLEHANALSVGRQAFAEAWLCRHPLLQGQAHWLVRCAEYRLETPSDPDGDIVSAAEQLGDPTLLAQLSFLEAAFAYRINEHARARGFLEAPCMVWTAGGDESNGVISAALALVCGKKFPQSEEARFCQAATRLLPIGLGLQAVALLVAAGAPRPPVDVVERLLKDIPPHARNRRMDVLSANEALALLQC